MNFICKITTSTALVCLLIVGGKGLELRCCCASFLDCFNVLIHIDSYNLSCVAKEQNRKS